jgi:peptidoglycan/LPS O-acetylase OafA/YrhL
VTRRFPLFDSIRAIAALLIVVRHAYDLSPAADPHSTAFPFFEATGGCALAAFFVASGFLLYRPFLAAQVAGMPRPGFGGYAVRRALRIAPGYWLALTVAAIWLSKPLVLGHASWQFYSLTYVYFGHALAGIGPAWSLCIEVAWYAMLPLFVVAITRLGGATPRERLTRAAMAVAVIGAVGVATRVYFSERAADFGFSPNVVPVTFLDWIALGMALAIVSVAAERRDELLPRGLRWLDRRPGIAWAAAAVAFLGAALMFRHPGTVFAHTGPWRPHLVYGAFAVALVAPAAIGDFRAGAVRRHVLANRALLWFGTVSYGIFLWHMPVLEQLRRSHLERIGGIHPYVLWPVVALTLSTAIAAASWYAFERPVLRLRRRLTRRPAQDPQPAPAPPVPTAGHPPPREAAAARSAT